MSLTRTYSSPLRAELQEQVKQRIVEKIFEVLGDPGAPEMSAAEVARRAEVSTRTVYRYFPTKEALFDAANEEMRKRIGHRSLPLKADEIAGNIGELFAGLAKNRELVLAMRSSKVAREIRARRKVVQRNAIAAAMAPKTKHIEDEGYARAVAALFNCLGSSDVWVEMTETWGVTTEQASKATQWAVETLLERLEREGEAEWKRKSGKRRDPAAGKSKTRT
jgi:AcrR family transcriptional regulator